MDTANFAGNGVLLKNIGNFAEDGGEVDTAALTAVWNGAFAVDSFFLMGAVLLGKLSCIKLLLKSCNYSCSYSRVVFPNFGHPATSSL